jgi:hypothetical protein
MKSVDRNKLEWLCNNHHLLNIVDLKTIDGSTGRKEQIFFHQELKKYFRIIYQGYGSKECLIDIIEQEKPPVI